MDLSVATTGACDLPFFPCLVSFVFVLLFPFFVPGPCNSLATASKWEVAVVVVEVLVSLLDRRHFAQQRTTLEVCNWKLPARRIYSIEGIASKEVDFTLKVEFDV